MSETPEDLAGRLTYLAPGLRARMLEHQWSYARWASRTRKHTWVFLFVTLTGAFLSALATTFTDSPFFGVLAAFLTAVAAVVTEYQRRFNPEATAAAHKRAEDGFSTLLTEYKDLKARLPRMSDDQAQQAFDELQARRQNLIHESIAVEEKTREAIAAKRRARKSRRDMEV